MLTFFVIGFLYTVPLILQEQCLYNETRRAFSLKQQLNVLFIFISFFYSNYLTLPHFITTLIEH